MEFPCGSPIPRGEDYGIIGEPYFDVTFDEVLYLTDTGRRWDGDAFNIRDKVETLELEKEGWIPSESGMDGGLDGWMNSLREWMNRMIPAGLGGRQKAESVIRNEELGNGGMEIGISKVETAKWK